MRQIITNLIVNLRFGTNLREAKRLVHVRGNEITLNRPISFKEVLTFLDHEEEGGFMMNENSIPVLLKEYMFLFQPNITVFFLFKRLESKCIARCEITDSKVRNYTAYKDYDLPIVNLNHYYVISSK